MQKLKSYSLLTHFLLKKAFPRVTPQISLLKKLTLATSGLFFHRAVIDNLILSPCRARCRVAALIISLILIPFGCSAQSSADNTSDSDTVIAKESPAETLEMRKKIMNLAKSVVGSPYVRGATGPDKFDCSGLIFYCYHEAGHQVQRTTKALYKHAKPISDDALRAGDLVFFHTTGDGSVSHVGLYVGNRQFISALSDGPNTGVVLSSLNEAYWKKRYIGGGAILDATLDKSLASSAGAQTATDDSANTAQDSPNSLSDDGERVNAYWAAMGAKAAAPKKKTLIESFALETSLTLDWQLFKSNDFVINWRGLQALIGITFTPSVIGAVITAGLRYNYGTDAVQIPITLGMLFGECIRIYLGPIFSIGTSHFGLNYTTDCGTGDKTKAQIFPGILGISFTTPSFGNDKVRARFIQDFNYVYYTKSNGAPLSAKKAAASGLTFSTGVIISIPFRVLKNHK